jgi:penicillin amidase
MRFQVLFLSVMVGGGGAMADTVRLEKLGGKVQIFFDAHAVPHVYAKDMEDAARSMGYLHATNRLWQMDMYRRVASGTTAEIMGPDGLGSDVLVRQLGIRRGCEAVWASDDLPAGLRAELEAYAEGVNAKIADFGDDHLPMMFKALGYAPAPWTPVESLVFTKYMGWDQGGTFDDLWFGMMVEKVGVAAAEELWPLDRPYEIPTVNVQADRRKLSRAALDPIPGGGAAYGATFKKLSDVKWFGRGSHFGSNNWAVDGTKTVSGKPILCSDPHLGFQLPAIWYTAHISAGGVNQAGVTFPGSPFIVIGHNDHHGWGITNMQADAVDFFVETLDPDDSTKYQHRGEWKKVDRVTETIPVKGGASRVLHIDYTVHGPLLRLSGKPISMSWTGFGPTRDIVGFWEISRAKSLKEVLQGLDKVIVPAINIVYADSEGNIALHPCGALPLRTRGQGRIPMDGASGENDWAGMIPRSELPLVVNPPNHFVASANGRPASIGYPHYLGWMWDPSYRTRRIHEMLGEAKEMTVDRMRAIQNDTYDKAAEAFVPVFLEAVKSREISDAFEKRVIGELAKWDFVADLDATGPAIWLRWLDDYRQAVWDDEWETRGIEKQDGSWGFTGNNRREPMLEVLEYITREHPESKWFDDRRTPEGETRDEMILRSFRSAAVSLKKQFGENPDQWAWKQTNVLRISALSGQAEMGRSGQPVPGTSFTVNPGGGIGHVGGGASWRMIVDFARPAGSIGVYPGGQSGNPTSEHYSDQIDVWATGRYLPLHAYSAVEDLAKDARVTELVLAP